MIVTITNNNTIMIMATSYRLPGTMQCLLFMLSNFLSSSLKGNRVVPILQVGS